MINQIDSGINILQFDARVIWRIGMPLFRIVADELVGLAGHSIDALDSRVRIRANQLHADNFLARYFTGEEGAARRLPLFCKSRDAQVRVPISPE